MNPPAMDLNHPPPETPCPLHPTASRTTTALRPSASASPGGMAALHHTVSHIHISSDQMQERNKRQESSKAKQALTRIPILLHPPGHAAPRRLLISLRLQARAAGAEAPAVHAALQRVALPPKHVVAVLAVPGRVARREHKRLRAVGRPVGFVVEACGVPDYLWRVRGLVG